MPVAVDAYLQSLRPIPSPHLVKGRLSPAARRGERLFRSARAGCVNCHPPPSFTDMAGHDVGTATAYHSMYQLPGADKASDRFYSPALVELWRTAPYLHDGSAASLRDVLTTCNPHDRHGHTVPGSRRRRLTTWWSSYCHSRSAEQGAPRPGPNC